jgi:putative phage-type endonuclease
MVKKMPEIINIDQNSPEWFKIRAGIASSSQFNRIITPEGKFTKKESFQEYGYELASSKYMFQDEETYKNLTMQNGNDIEPWARQLYQEKTLNIVEEVGFIKHDDGFFGASTDGLVGKDGLIEIKRQMHKLHMKALCTGEYNKKYKPQIQGELLVTGRKWCDFISFNENFDPDTNIVIIRVERDEEYIKLLYERLKELNSFINEILNKEC